VSTRLYELRAGKVKTTLIPPLTCGLYEVVWSTVFPPPRTVAPDGEKETVEMAKQENLASWSPKAEVVRETGIRERGSVGASRHAKSGWAICTMSGRRPGLQPSAGDSRGNREKNDLRAEEAAPVNDQVSLSPCRKRP
jgi:hypothetical protein